MVTKGERGWRRDKLGVWGQQIQTNIFKIDRQQGPTVQHRELYSISCNKLNHDRKEHEKAYIYSLYIYIYIYIYIKLYIYI